MENGVKILNNTKKSKRIFYFDALRALAIIVVILFHLSNDCSTLVCNKAAFLSSSWMVNDILRTCCRFGVDLFLMLSGALSLGRKWEIREFLGKRIPRIVEPFLFWGFALSAFLFVFCYNNPYFVGVFESFTLKGFLVFLVNAYLYNKAPINFFGQYWFFWMIIGTYLIMPIFNKWLYHSDLKEAEYFLVLWLVTCLFTETLDVFFPVRLNYFAGPIGMVVLGYYLRHTERKVFNNPYVGILMAVVSWIVLVSLSVYQSTPSDMVFFSRYSIFVVMEVTGIFLIFKNYSKLNIKSKILNNPKGILRRSASSIARYSYGIYLVHRVILLIVFQYLSGVIPFKLLIVTMFVSALGGSWLLLSILNRVPYVNRVIGAK